MVIIIAIIIINHILYVDANPVVSHTSNNPQGVDCISALAGLIRYLCKLIFATVHLHIYAFFYFFCNFRINIIQCFITTWYNWWQLKGYTVGWDWFGLLKTQNFVLCLLWIWIGNLILGWVYFFNRFLPLKDAFDAVILSQTNIPLSRGGIWNLAQIFLAKLQIPALSKEVCN